MYGKVSMVVPCYNKEKYIGAMLDSVIAQKWDNIEVILVNDGSTDGTRKIIAEYIKKIEERGYEAVIIDQDNAGCCAAVFTGLTQLTGDYFCLVDCDDEIMPDYVSRMAGWLEENKDYEVSACNYFHANVNERGGIRLSPIMAPQYFPNAPDLLERFLLCQTLTSAWVYLTRSHYVDRILKSFCTERRKTYEPLIVNPIASGNGKVKFFNEGLYKFNLYANGFVNLKTYNQVEAYYEDYYYLHEWTIKRLGFNADYEKKLLAFAELGCLGRIMYYVSRLPENEIDGAWGSLAMKFISFINNRFTLSENVTVGEIVKHKDYLLELLEYKIRASNVSGMKRIVGYGALGRSAQQFLPVLNGTAMRPTELWDIRGDGVIIKKPEFETLRSGDAIIFFPTSHDAYKDVCEEISKRGVNVDVFRRDDVCGMLHAKTLLSQILSMH